MVVYNRQAEQPIVDVFSDSDFVFVRDAWWTSPRSVGNNLKCGGGSGEAEFYALTKSECIESSVRSGHG